MGVCPIIHMIRGVAMLIVYIGKDTGAVNRYGRFMRGKPVEVNEEIGKKLVEQEPATFGYFLKYTKEQGV